MNILWFIPKNVALISCPCASLSQYMWCPIFLFTPLEVTRTWGITTRIVRMNTVFLSLTLWVQHHVIILVSLLFRDSLLYHVMHEDSFSFLLSFHHLSLLHRLLLLSPSITCLESRFVLLMSLLFLLLLQPSDFICSLFCLILLVSCSLIMLFSYNL